MNIVSMVLLITLSIPFFVFGFLVSSVFFSLSMITAGIGSIMLCLCVAGTLVSTAVNLFGKKYTANTNQLGQHWRAAIWQRDSAAARETFKQSIASQTTIKSPVRTLNLISLVLESVQEV